MVKNSDFLGCKEERKKASFVKVLQGADISSENMRALPHYFVRTLSETDLSREMKIKADWRRLRKVSISKNPRFFFMEMAGWEKFVRDNFLGDGEFITFTHVGKMHFAMNIFNKDGREMIQPRQTAPFLASSNRVKTENREGVHGDVKKEDVVVSSELYCLQPATTARSTGRGRLNLGNTKVEESQTSKRSKTKVRGSDGDTSSSATGFSITIKKSHFKFLTIPKTFAKDYMKERRTKLKIHDQDMNKSWHVFYLKRKTCATFGGG